MEIERKFLVDKIPFALDEFECKDIRQGYISMIPTIRIRKSDNRFFLTVKGKGLMAREEFETGIDVATYTKLVDAVDGNIIQKKRYIIPIEDSELKIELDIFEGLFKGLIYAEVEFPDEETAKTFTPPEWFGRDVTKDGNYQNSYLSRMTRKQIKQLLKEVKAK